MTMITETTTTDTTDEQRTITIEEFISKHSLTMDYHKILCRSGQTDFGKGASHYAVTLHCKYPNDDMQIEYSMGSAHTRGPQIADVVDCLAMDSAGVDGNRSFEEWAGEYGYDEDSRKAEQTYNLCVKQRDQLVNLLGHDAYQELLYSTERL